MSGANEKKSRTVPSGTNSARQSSAANTATAAGAAAGGDAKRSASATIAKPGRCVVNLSNGEFSAYNKYDAATLKLMRRAVTRHYRQSPHATLSEKSVRLDWKSVVRTPEFLPWDSDSPPSASARDKLIADASRWLTNWWYRRKLEFKMRYNKETPVIQVLRKEWWTTGTATEDADFNSWLQKLASGGVSTGAVTVLISNGNIGTTNYQFTVNSKVTTPRRVAAPTAAASRTAAAAAAAAEASDSGDHDCDDNGDDDSESGSANSRDSSNDAPSDDKQSVTDGGHKEGAKPVQPLSSAPPPVVAESLQHDLMPLASFEPADNTTAESHIRPHSGETYQCFGSNIAATSNSNPSAAAAAVAAPAAVSSPPTPLHTYRWNGILAAMLALWTIGLRDTQSSF